MINLLPPEETSHLLIQQRRKLVFVLGITAIIPLLCFALVLLSLQFYLLGQIASQQVLLEQARKEYETPEFIFYRDVIKQNNALLAKLQTFSKKEIRLTDAVKAIAGVKRPQGLLITSITVSRTKDEKIKVAASGFSPSREDLIAFQKNMQANPALQAISFTPESWVNPKDIRFSVSFEVAS